MNRFLVVFEPRRGEARERTPVHYALRMHSEIYLSFSVCLRVRASLAADGVEKRVRPLPLAGSGSARPEFSLSRKREGGYSERKTKREKKSVPYRL